MPLPPIPTQAADQVNIRRQPKPELKKRPKRVEIEETNPVEEATAPETLESPEIQKRMIDQGADPAYLNPDQFTKYLAAEMPKWARAVKQAGAKLD